MDGWMDVSPCVRELGIKCGMFGDKVWGVLLSSYPASTLCEINPNL